MAQPWASPGAARSAGVRAVTKKEIVKQIADRLGLTQLKTKEIVQRTFDAIVDTLLEDGRIELRNFGVFEVKQRKARKARNPRTGDKVDVPPKNVVTFKPGKIMEEKVRNLTHLPAVTADRDGSEEDLVESGNGVETHGGAVPVGAGAAQGGDSKAKRPRPRKTTHTE